ncbi:hypothetical protein AC579_5673, partial [Pseudocercospora musae]
YLAHFQKRCQNIKTESLTRIQETVWEAGQHPEAVPVQRDIIVAGLTKILDMLHPGKEYTPTEAQVEVLYALICGQADVLMIARTGVGKSLVFQGFTLLTGMVTIQVVLLNRLGVKQAAAVERIGRGEGLVHSCHITAETERLDPAVYDNIKNGSIQHILLVRDRIGLQVFDECHLIHEWGEEADFRPEHSQVHQIREYEATTEYVSQHSGMRTVGNGHFESRIIRSSIDRPEVTYIVKFIPKDLLATYDYLYCIIDHAVSYDKMRKVLIFIDGRKYCANFVLVVRSWLVWLTKDNPDLAKRYTYKSADGSIDVTRTITVYTATVPTFDQDARYTEYCKPDSEIRCVGATTAFSVGLDVPNIGDVFQIKLPSLDIKATSCFLSEPYFYRPRDFFFVPYYDSDYIKKTPESSNLPAIAVTTRGGRRVRGRGRGGRGGGAGASRLRQVEIPSEDVSVVSDQDDVRSEAASEVASDASNGMATGSKGKKKSDFWNETELKARASVPKIFMDALNSYIVNPNRCFRAVMNEVHGEHTAIFPHPKGTADPADCCDQHNPELMKDLPLPPKPLRGVKPVTPLGAGSRPACALLYIRKWCSEKADSMFPLNGRRFRIPGSYFVRNRIMWAVADVFKSAREYDAWVDVDSEKVLKTAQEMKDWQHRDTALPDLCLALNGMAEQVCADWEAAKAAKAKKKEAKAAKEAAEKLAQKAAENPQAQGQTAQQMTPEEREAELLNMRQGLHQSAQANTIRQAAMINQQIRANANPDAGTAASAAAIDPQAGPSTAVAGASTAGKRPERSGGSATKKQKQKQPTDAGGAG